MKHLLAAIVLCPSPLLADIPNIENAIASAGTNGWRFDVTLSNPDTGWEHYADGWRIEDAQGNQLGYRELVHPHVNEQPFTRSLSGVAIPKTTAVVFVRAHGSIDGWGETLFKIELNP